MSYFRWRWYRSGLLVCISVILCLLLHIGWAALPGMKVAAQTPPAQLVQQGIERYQAGDFRGAIAPWQIALPQVATAADRATIHTNLAQAYRQIGQLAEAIAKWEQASEIYRRLETDTSLRTLAAVQVEQAQAYSQLGQHQRAISLLNIALELPHTYLDPSVEMAAQGALGDAYSALGDYERALEAYQIGLTHANALSDTPDAIAYRTTALNNLGNLYTKQTERYQFLANSALLDGEQPEADRLNQLATQTWSQARQTYEQSWQLSQTVGGLTEAIALLNLDHLLEQSPSTADQALLTPHRVRIQSLLTTAPDSRTKAYALINLARRLQDRAQSNPLLEQALMVARAIGDQRAESFALGSLGELEEIAKRYTEAMLWTQQAQFVAQQINAPESLYRWQWQSGRIFKATRDRQRAIAAYKQAIATLQTIRSDIISANRDLQFNFRDSVEPVYRDLIGLLLDEPPGEQRQHQENIRTREIENRNENENSVDDNTREVLDILELLKLAELQNFFGDECVQVAREQMENNSALADTSAAIVYSVILSDHTEIILRSPNGTLTHYPIALTANQLQTEISTLRALLEKRTTDEYLPQAQKVYDLFIRPIEADLAAIHPRTLVLVNDGVLRNIPFAALHDGQQFFVQTYAIATTPSLTLTTTTPMDRRNLRALTAGLTVARPPFAALINVNSETEGVQKLLGGPRLIDREFTLTNLQTHLTQHHYPIIHLATHGKFGVDSGSTFLLAYDDRIQIEQIDNLLRIRPGSDAVELLTLSACQTAAGDNRTTLGIAGVAVRAGVKTALATLWYINDESTVPLIESFYTQLRQPNVTKAEALRHAQLALINNQDYPEYSHPAVWAPFILVGNWL